MKIWRPIQSITLMAIAFVLLAIAAFCSSKKAPLDYNECVVEESLDFQL